MFTKSQGSTCIHRAIELSDYVIWSCIIQVVFLSPKPMSIFQLFVAIEIIPSLADENVPIYSDRYWNDSVQRHEERPAHLGQQTKGNVVPYLLGIGKKYAHQKPNVGDTVEVDHVVDERGVRPVPDPVHDVRVDREADGIDHSDGEDVEKVPLMFRQKNHISHSDFKYGIVPGKLSR